jgi:inner membrane protein
VLKRGIYEAVVYRAVITMSGRFSPPSLSDLDLAVDELLWDEAYLTVGMPDLRGINDRLILDWGGQSFPLVPAPAQTDLPSGVKALLKGASRISESQDFRLEVTLNGSEGIRVAPVGNRNHVRITSTWADPAFLGYSLPAERQVDADGFAALWQTTHFGRNYPPAWTSTGSPPVTRNDLLASSYGVDLLSVVDHYRLTERAIKYGILFFVLVFTAFFLFEITGHTPVHPFQYAVVGCALCLFYLTLLSLSEFIPFRWAYLAGATICTGMISLYSINALRSRRRALMILAELSALYGILFVMLRMQDVSLLLGTAGLLIALSIVMYTTRNMDWYAKDYQGAE